MLGFALMLSLSLYMVVCRGFFMAKLTNSHCVYTSYTEKCRKYTERTEQKASMDSMFFSRFWIVFWFVFRPYFLLRFLYVCIGPHSHTYTNNTLFAWNDVNLQCTHLSWKAERQHPAIQCECMANVFIMYNII